MKLLDKLSAKIGGYEIMKLKDIKIDPFFKFPNKNKLERYRRYIEKYGICKELIVVDDTNWLIDGYTSYILLTEYGEDEALVLRYKNETNRRR